VEVVASLSQGRTAAVQCGLFTHKSVPVIFEPPCTISQHITVRTDCKTGITEGPIGRGLEVLIKCNMLLATLWYLG